jgi:hypothetical protein
MRTPPASVEQPARIGSLHSPADLVDAAACQHRPSPGDDLVHDRAGHVAGVPKDPAHVVVWARDEPVERHHRMDEDVAHHHLRNSYRQ